MQVIKNEDPSTDNKLPALLHQQRNAKHNCSTHSGAARRDGLGLGGVGCGGLLGATLGVWTRQFS